MRHGPHASSPGMHGDPGMDGGLRMRGPGMGRRPIPPPRKRGCLGCFFPFLLIVGGLVTLIAFAIGALF